MCTRPRETSTKLDVEESDGIPSDQVSSPGKTWHMSERRLDAKDSLKFFDVTRPSGKTFVQLILCGPRAF